MKTFNRTISIEVEVDAIAKQLLAQINPEFKHRDIVCDAIIGTGLEAGTLSYIYNALGGYPPAVNFAIGDVVNCTDKVYQYRTEESRKNRDSTHEPVGTATVVEINEYATKKLRVEYDKYFQDNSVRKADVWVSLDSCKLVPAEQTDGNGLIINQ